MDLSYRQLKQIFDNLMAAYPNDFTAATTSASLPSTGASSPTSTVTSTATTTPTATATPTVTATETTTSTASLPSTGAATSSLTPSQNAALALIAKAQGQINFGNANGIDTSQLQAAVADLQEILNGADTKGLATIEGNGKRNSSIVTDYSDRNARQSYQRKLDLSYRQLKQIYDSFVATYG